MNNLRVNGAIFLNDYEDRQLSQFRAGEGSGGASSVITNAGEQENLGLEIDVAWAISEELTLMFAYGYLDSEFKTFVTGEVDPITGLAIRDNMGVPIERDLSDEPGVIVPFAPENTASLQLEYQYGNIGFGDLSFWLGASYSSEIVYEAQQHIYNSTGDYTLIDARITLADIALGDAAGNLRLSLWGRNITNEEVREWGIDFGGFLGFTVNTYKELASLGLGHWSTTTDLGPATRAGGFAATRGTQPGYHGVAGRQCYLITAPRQGGCWSARSGAAKDCFGIGAVHVYRG